MPKAKAAKAAPRPASGPVTLLIGTRKGVFLMKSDRARKSWTLAGPHFLGNIVNHLVLDPRDGRTLLCAVRAGHLGPTVFRSTDFGHTWKEAERPPAFPKAAPGEKGLSVEHVFWLTPGHSSEPGAWYAGVSPPGLFRSDDGGVTWEGVAGFNANPMRIVWIGGEQEQGPPGGATLHSINVDPRDPRHLYIGISAGGAFESSDRGETWRPLNQGVAADFLPVKDPEYGHDVHCMRLHPLAPDRLYQQNHCGIYRTGAASARSRHAVGISDGRRHRMAARLPGRQARGLRLARRRPDLAPPGQGPPGQAGLVHREAAGDVRRRARSGGRVLRHDERRGLDECERRRALDLDRAPPSRNLFCRGGRRLKEMNVLIPSQLRDYTGGRAQVEARGATLAALLADLERRYPGIRFRMIDEQDAIRRHIRIFVNQQQAPDLSAALAANDEVVIVGALSGG